MDSGGQNDNNDTSWDSIWAISFYGFFVDFMHTVYVSQRLWLTQPSKPNTVHMNFDENQEARLKQS